MKWLVRRGAVIISLEHEPFFSPQFVLSKYGYLACHKKRRKREAGSLVPSRSTHRRIETADDAEQRNLWSGLKEGVGSDGCRKDEVLEAILHYQTTYNLPVTGILDKETMSLMSTSRCGNKDSEEDDGSHSKLREEGLGPRRNSDSASQSASSAHDAVNSGVDTSDPVRKEDSNEKKTPNRLWRRSANLQNSRLLSVITETNKLVGRTESAHRIYLQDFIEKERQKQKLSGRNAKSVNKRWRNLLFKRYTQGERRKRSVHARLAKRRRGLSLLFSNDVVTWRLLTTGLSTRIPLIDQRASIHLAFRMWSEVIPLTFKEDNDGHIDAVDIEIAFGKGRCEKVRYLTGTLFAFLYYDQGEISKGTIPLEGKKKKKIYINIYI